MLVRSRYGDGVLDSQCVLERSRVPGLLGAFPCAPEPLDALQCVPDVVPESSRCRFSRGCRCVPLGTLITSISTLSSRHHPVLSSLARPISTRPIKPFGRSSHYPGFSPKPPLVSLSSSSPSRLPFSLRRTSCCLVSLSRSAEFFWQSSLFGIAFSLCIYMTTTSDGIRLPKHPRPTPSEFKSSPLRVSSDLSSCPTSFSPLLPIAFEVPCWYTPHWSIPITTFTHIQPTFRPRIHTSLLLAPLSGLFLWTSLQREEEAPSDRQIASFLPFRKSLVWPVTVAPKWTVANSKWTNNSKLWKSKPLNLWAN